MDKPAFPTSVMREMVGMPPISGLAGGLTRRELFAAMAMQGLLSHGGYYREMPESAAKDAKKHADALCAELDKGVG